MGALIPLGSGKMSTFGGPADDGVGPHEGLALVGPGDLTSWWFSCLFLAEQPPGTTGLARRLNPEAFYLAMRWDYARFSHELLRRTVVKLTNPANGLEVLARPVDFGPGDGTLIDGTIHARYGAVGRSFPGRGSGAGVADGWGGGVRVGGVSLI